VCKLLEVLQELVDQGNTVVVIERHILVKRAAMQGFLLFDYAARFQEARTQLAAWLTDGRLTYREEVLDGLERAPGAIAHLYAGGNLGKLVIRI
jgi:NADPH-dependent curcumin reductase CurA